MPRLTGHLCEITIDFPPLGHHKPKKCYPPSRKSFEPQDKIYIYIYIYLDAPTHGIGAAIRIGQAIQCHPYAGYLLDKLKKTTLPLPDIYTCCTYI